MRNRWYNVPKETVPDPVDGHDVEQPKHSDEVESWTGFALSSSPRFIVRYYSDESVLESIENEPGVSELDRKAALNFLSSQGVDVSADKMEELFARK